MKKLFIAIAILVSCMMASMSFATNYYASGTVYVTDQTYAVGDYYDVQIGVYTEYPTWSGFVYYLTSYYPPNGVPFTLSISPQQVSGPVPYNPQTTNYYRVYVQVTKHIVNTTNTVVESGWSYAGDVFNGTDYLISANNTISVNFP
jgi:hypothetical protein